MFERHYRPGIEMFLQYLVRIKIKAPFSAARKLPGGAFGLHRAEIAPLVDHVPVLP